MTLALTAPADAQYYDPNQSWQEYFRDRDAREAEDRKKQREIDAHRREQNRKVPGPGIIGVDKSIASQPIQQSTIPYKALMDQSDKHIGSVVVMRGRIESFSQVKKNHAVLVLNVTQDPSYAKLWSDPIVFEIVATEDLGVSLDQGTILDVNGKFVGLEVLKIGDKTVSVPRLTACADHAAAKPIVPRC